MKTTHLRIVVILLSLAFSWLLVIGIGGWIGVLLGAVLCLLVVDKCYEGKSFLKNLSDEFRLPPYCDLALAICLIVDLLKGSIVFSPIVCLLLLLFILDFTRQIKRLKKREISDWI